MSGAEDILEEIKLCIINMEDQRAAELARQALQHWPAAEILNRALIPGMEFVGNEYEEGKKFIPEMLLASEAMTAALGVLKPELAASGTSKVGRVVMGTVEGDVHDIGQRLVCIMLEGAGFEVHSLGVDVAPGAFVQAAREESPNIIGMSALLTTTAPAMKRTIDALAVNGLRDKVKVMVGGAAVNQHLAEQVGADGFAPDAAAAVRLAKTLIAG